MKNIMTLLQKWLVIAVFGRKNTRDSVGNHMPAKGINKPATTQRNSDGSCSRGSTGSITTTITTVATRTKTTRQSLPPPLPPQPHHRRRNRCPCGECFVRRKFNTPGECSFHAKAAVAVGGDANAITTTSGESSHQRLHQPLPPLPPPKSPRLR